MLFWKLNSRSGIGIMVQGVEQIRDLKLQLAFMIQGVESIKDLRVELGL